MYAPAPPHFFVDPNPIIGFSGSAARSQRKTRGGEIPPLYLAKKAIIKRK
jgi:hypothetical protein